jgi:hypothetical protein
MSGTVVVVYLIAAVLGIAGLWTVFQKAGLPGWGAVVPVYNAYLICKVIGRPGWWVVLFFIPFVNIVIAIIVGIEMAKCFAKSGGFAVGLILLGFVFYPILGFGAARYSGPALPA